MTFKEMLEMDIANVFFNLDEFADEHELDGETIPLIIDEGREQMNGLPISQRYAAQEVYKKYKTIFVKSTDYYVPKIDSSIELNGSEYYVEEADEVQGIIRIVVYANES